MSDLLDGIGIVVVVFHEVENRSSQQLENDANVAAVVEPVQHLHAQVLPFGVFAVEFFENVDLELGSFSVFVDALDDLDGDLGPLSSVNAVMIDDLRYFAERSFAQMTNDFVSAMNEIASLINEMSFLVVGRRHWEIEQVSREGK